MMRKIGIIFAVSLLMGCQGSLSSQTERSYQGAKGLQAPYFSRLPAVWAVRKDSAVITFSTQSKVSFLYGENPKILQEGTNTGTGNDHRYVLASLTPATRYHYQVKGPEGIQEGSFTTEAPGPFTFAVYGDSRPHDGDELPEVFGTVVKEMAKRAPRLAVAVGDNIQLTPGYFFNVTEKVVRGRYDAYLRGINPLNCTIPIYPALGNHDRGTDPIAMKGFNEAFVLPQNGGPGYYSWDYAGKHFVVLNTELENRKAELGTSQLQWLERDLKNSSGLTFVFLHRPLYGGAHGNDFEHSNTTQRDQLATMFKQNRVKAVFCGHDHYYNHKLVDGIHYVVTGGAGAPESDAPAGGAEGPHYLMVSVDGDRISAEVLSDTGKNIASW